MALTDNQYDENNITDTENQVADTQELSGQFSPIYSFTQKTDRLAKEGKIEYPKYRTLSQEQGHTYLKAKDLPAFQRKQMQVDLQKSSENDFATNAKNAAIVEWMDILSGKGTELALGNMLVTEDYAPLVPALIEGYGAETAAQLAKKGGSGFLSRLAAGAAGGALTAGVITALTPTETATQEQETAGIALYNIEKELNLTDEDLKNPYLSLMTGKINKDQYEYLTSEIASGPFGYNYRYMSFQDFMSGGREKLKEKGKERAREGLKGEGFTDAQIEEMANRTGLQRIGYRLLADAMNKMEYNAAIAPSVDEDSIAARGVQAAASMGEYMLTAMGASAIARKTAKAIKTPKDRFGRKAAEFTAKKGTPYEDVVDRYSRIVGTKTGSAAATTEMSMDIMGQGALESVRQYIDETGDTELRNYEGDIKNVALDVANTHINNIIENKLGVGKLFKNPRLSTKYGEWLNGLAQEFSQGEVTDVFEWIKGNKTALEVLQNIPNNAVDGVFGGFGQGAIGTGQYYYFHNKNVNDLTGVIMGQSTKEKPIDQKKARQFAENLVNQVEEEVATDLSKEITDFTGMTQYQGKIYETIRDNVKKAIDYQRGQMKDTLEGSKYDDMTEDELAQHIESVAQDETDRTVIEALESGTPLSESPRLKGETIDGTYYLEGSDYAKETAEESERQRQMIRDAIYAEKQEKRDLALAEKIAEKAEETRAKREKAETERQTKEAQERERLAERNAKQVVKAIQKSIKESEERIANDIREVKQAIIKGDANVISEILSKAGFKTRGLSGTDIKNYAKLNWTLFKGKDLGQSQKRGSAQTKLSDIEQNVESGDKVLERAGYAPEEIKKMDDETWNRAVLTQYRKESAETQVQEPELTAEELAQIPDDLQFQDLADENESLDAIYPEYTGETIEVDGKERTVYNSNGVRIAKSKEALTNFWRWFGDSKVVDEQGRPLVVYHGTSSKFDTFSIDESGKNTGTAIYGQGFYFTTDKEIATKWGAKRGEPIVMGVYVKLENPNMVKELEYPKDSKEKGFDGVIAKVWGGNELEIVAFEPNQIKSVDNRGTYSADTGNIYYQDRQRGKGGAYDARNRSITLGSGANVTTFPHELAHYWIDKNFKWARSGKASTAWLQQWRAVEKWLGIAPEDKYLSSAASEKFARAYERFLGEEQLPLVLKKSMADFRDFVLDHYDYELDDAKGLQDKLGRPIHLNEDVKNWFKKSVYDSYMSASDMEVVNQRLAQDDQQSKEVAPEIEKNQKLEKAAQNSPEISEVAPTGSEIQTDAKMPNDVILGKKSIGGGEEKESKGAIAGSLGKTYESTSWDIQDQMVNNYLETVSIDEAMNALEDGTYPDKIDPNFLRQALVEKLLDEGREIEAAALIEETADDFTQAAQTLQAARRINTPFTNAIHMLTIGKATKLAEARYGKNKDAVKSLDAAINALVAKYEQDFMNAKTDEERELVYATMQDEAIRTIGTLEKDKTGGLDFQDIEDKEDRKQAKELRKRQIRRASINGYRSRAKRALKQALGLEPTREQVRQIKKLSVKVAREIKDFRKAVKENKTSAIDPTKILEAQNELNEYMNKQLPPRVLSNAMDAINSYMMANMLWNPATNVFNLESTWVQMIPHMLATRINYGKGTIPWKEKIKLIKQALALQAKTGYNIFSLQDFFDKKTIWAEKFYEPTSTAGKAIRFPLTILGLADTMNKGVVFLQHADAMATKQAKEEGKKNNWNKEQITQRAKELFYQALNTDPRTITRDGLKIRESAVREGEEATFTQDTKTAQFVNKFRKMLNFGAKTGLGNVIMPFTTTIANIAEDTVLNYALGSVRGLVNAPKALATQFDKTATAEMKKEAWNKVKPETKNVIKNIIGVLMLLALALNDPDDDSYVLGYDRQTEVDKDIRQNRNAPSGYAVRMGNRWVDLDLFGIGSPWARAYLIAKRHDFSDDGWVKGIASIIDLVPGIGEIEDIYKSFETTAKYKSESEALMDFVGGKGEDILERLIPAQALFNEIGNITDTTKRVGYGGVKERVLSKIPYARKTLEERTSKQTGEPIKQTDTVFNLITGQRVKQYVESTPADRARYELAKEGSSLNYQEGRSKLKDLGKDSPAYKKAVARVRRDFTRKLNSAVQTSEYQNLDTEQKKKFADKLHKEVLEDVKEDFGLAKKKPVAKKKKKK